MKEAEHFGLVQDVRSGQGVLSFTLTYLQDNFLNGGWLELYVWNEARHIQLPDGQALFDDCQWNHKVTISGVKRELDVSLTYRAQLLIAECKTGIKDISSETLKGLVSVANQLGGRFVGKVFISSLFSPFYKNAEPAQKDGTLREQIVFFCRATWAGYRVKGHQEFLDKAAHHQIVVIMGEDLPRIRDLLAKEARTSKYPRM